MLFPAIDVSPMLILTLPAENYKKRRLSLWQEGGSRCEISLKFLNTGKQEEASLPLQEPWDSSVRKYVCAAEARGYHQGDPMLPQGWKAFLREVVPRPPDPSTQSEVSRRLLPYQDEIRQALATTTAATIRVFIAISAAFSPMSGKSVRRSDPPPGEEAQIDFGYLGMWQDPLTGRGSGLCVTSWPSISLAGRQRELSPIT
ncbi:hypothetical protein M1N08_01500 [Dehalococcoidia bacterium]|nr:hypothetical protein [Dehalococcoidia bacterium]